MNPRKMQLGHLLTQFALATFSTAVLGQADPDSLRALLKRPQHDTTTVRLLNELAAIEAADRPDSTIVVATRALKLAETIDFGPGRAEALKNLGHGHLQREEYGVARVHFQRSLDAWDHLGRKDQLIKLHQSLSYCAQQSSDFPVALEHSLAQLRLVEQMGDRRAGAAIKSTIGNIHDQMENADEAERWQKEALHTYEELNDSLGIAQASNNLGNTLDAHGKGDEALTHLERALAIARALDNPMGVAICKGAIANHYQRNEDFEKALAMNREVIAFFEELDDPFSLAAANINTGEILTHLERYEEAKDHLRRGLSLSRPIGAKQWITNAHAGLYDVAMKEGNADSALVHFTKYVDYRDSIQNEANTRKAVQLQMQYDFEKKEAVAKAAHEVEVRRQKLVRNGFVGGFVLVALFAGVFLAQRNRIGKEKARSEELLLNILPEEVAEELKAKGEAEAVQIDQVTVLFTDFKGFTAMSEVVTPSQLVKDLNECFSAFDRITEKYGIEKIKTIGDAYMAAGGLPTPNSTHAMDVLMAALEMREFIAVGKAQKQAAGQPYFEIRIGIHTGPVVAGIVGVKKFQYDIWGDTVNTASRMESSGEVGQVNISEATYVLVKNDASFTFTPRGKVQAKGKGELEMYFVHRSSTGA
ncbi:MAG: tetratricopeptide repeat protein [Flavobacteriales bacterium]|nr:tetratricopeptide repeat protein [Flavobacteriales bacterium]